MKYLIREVQKLSFHFLNQELFINTLPNNSNPLILLHSLQYSIQHHSSYGVIKWNEKIWNVRKLKCDKCNEVFSTNRKSKYCSLQNCNENVLRQQSYARFFHYQSENEEMITLNTQHIHKEPNYSKIDPITKDMITQVIQLNPKIKPHNLQHGMGLPNNIHAQELNPSLGNKRRLQNLVRELKISDLGPLSVGAGMLDAGMKKLWKQQQQLYDMSM